MDHASYRTLIIIYIIGLIEHLHMDANQAIDSFFEKFVALFSIKNQRIKSFFRMNDNKDQYAKKFSKE